MSVTAVLYFDGQRVLTSNPNAAGYSDMPGYTILDPWGAYPVRLAEDEEVKQ